MSNRTTIEQLEAMDAAGVAALPLDHVMLLREDIAAMAARVKALTGRLDDMMSARFADQAQATRRAEGKDTGVARIQVGDLVVVADTPKKVEWDQAKLREAAATIKSWGEPVEDYITFDLSVSETRFKGWPTSIKKIVEPARTVKPSRQTFKIEFAKREAA